MPPRPRPTPALADDDEYGTVDVHGSLHLLSLGLFAAALGARFWVALVPADLRPLPMHLLSALAVPALAGLGLLAGMAALRAPRGREIARLAVFLNAVALILGALSIAAFFYILRR
jgi:hypothetical protein